MRQQQEADAAAQQQAMFEAQQAQLSQVARDLRRVAPGPGKPT